MPGIMSEGVGLKFCDQVCSTASTPMRAPRWRGSAAILSSVSDAARNNML